MCHTYILVPLALSLSVFRLRTLEDRKEEEERILLASDVGKLCHRGTSPLVAAAASIAVAILWRRQRWLHKAALESTPFANFAPSRGLNCVTWNL